MERRLLLSTVAVALVLGTAAATAQTRRPADQNAPPATPSQNEPRANPQSGAGAQNAPMPQGQAQQRTPAQPNMPNAQQSAPRATTGQAAPPTQQSPSNAANPAPQPAAGQAQTQPQQQGMPAQGQAQGQTQGQAQGQGPAQPGMTQGNTAGANGDTNAQQNANTNANANAGTSNPQGVITLNEQQNTRVAQAIRQANVRPLTNVSFSIAVGTTIPADVQLNVLPLELVEVVPQYRGFSFVVVEQEALIIDPGTRAIVAVVPFEARQTTGANQAAPPPAGAPAQAAAPPPRERKKIDLTRDQREIQRRQAERHHKSDKNKHVIIEERRTTTGAGPREPRVGDRVPDSAVIERRPVEVYRDEPPVRDDRPHPSVRDIPLIGPLIGPRDED
jgi:hypothetical protein